MHQTWTERTQVWVRASKVERRHQLIQLAVVDDDLNMVGGGR